MRDFAKGSREKYLPILMPLASQASSINLSGYSLRLVNSIGMVVFIRHLMYATPFIKEVSKRYRLKPYQFRRALLKDGFLHAMPMSPFRFLMKMELANIAFISNGSFLMLLFLKQKKKLNERWMFLLLSKIPVPTLRCSCGI